MLTHLAARDFRNLAPLSWRPAAGSHLLLGGNGAGKTSLLEAVYVLATTRSFRASQIADCARHGTGSFHVQGEVETDRRSTLEVGWMDGQRMRALNGKVTPLAEHLAVLPVVAWTAAAEAEVLVGAPKARRRFMDRGLVGIRPSALEVLGRYREALRQKRGLLLGAGAGIEIWNEMLAATAADVIAQRHRYIERLKDHLTRVVAASGLPFPPIELHYRPSPANGLEGQEIIADALDRIADRERRRQIPLLGPQRDELEILWGGHEIRRVASAGERKALSLMLIAAHGRVMEEAGRRPLYLLDDLDAELAPPTVAAVWNVLKGEGQLFSTSNRPQVWLTLEVGTIWEVERGELRLISA
ncbi:MAG TPA: DNA replication and repair protein RecF [Thermoanaerobaculia bacterium]|jgi:DNA replication and repair protein RecF|nr:DNA replication and repair protein RecF [Thermoanaerobaculia bacterium]